MDQTEVTQEFEAPVGVCAVGASAGGLEPLEVFFGSMPVDTNLAFVVVQHLSPDHGSMMDSLLSRHTSMPVNQAVDGEPLRPNSVYLIPPDRVIAVDRRRLQVAKRDHSSARPPSPHPIDVFFRSLARDWGARSAAVVLSGTGDDGADGIQVVRRAGGLTLAQDDSASFTGMPKAAFGTGYVDAVASVPEIVNHVCEFFAIGKRPSPESIDAQFLAAEESILEELATSTGINFADYKKGTVRRRLRHRMNALGISTLQQMHDVVRHSAEESEELTHDILIGVTSFFRDPEVYEELAAIIEGLLIVAAAEDRQLRIWSAGCASGQEPYSLAILCFEARERLQMDCGVQVFGTDVHQGSLQRASDGVYTEAEMDGVSAERRERFFHHVDGGWKINQEIRRAVTFAQQNMLVDTPFSRIDLVVCRNVLIYFSAVAQQRAQWAIGFSLRNDGILLLGTSESPGFAAPDFDAISPQKRLFKKSGDAAIRSFRRRMGPELAGGLPLSATTRPALGSDRALLQAYDTILDQHFGAGLLVDSRNELVHVLGDAKRWLSHPTGRPSRDVLSLIAEPSLKVAVGAILREVTEGRSGEVQRLFVSGLGSGEEDEVERLAMRGEKIRAAGSVFTLITARPVEQSVEVPAGLISSAIDPDEFDRISQLEADLNYTRESLQAALEEQETSNEELNAANEELIASNEELQSSNEELSALNEELRTLNDEHHRRLQEVLELTADLEHILSSTEIGILLIDEDNAIRRFSEPARDYFHLMASDQGRPFEHIRARFDSTELDLAVADALQQGRSATLRADVVQRDQEVLISVRPYALPQGGLGAAITVVELGAAAKSRREALLSSLVETSPIEVFVFNEDRVCLLHSGEFSTNVQGESLDQIALSRGMKLSAIQGLFDQVDEMSSPYAGVVRMPTQNQAMFVWPFTSASERCYGLMAAGVDHLRATLADWVESQTVGVIADLTGVGAAVVHPDGSFGARYNARTSRDGDAPLDLSDNMQALSDIVASSAELGFDHIEQSVDMSIDGTSRRVYARGVRLGAASTSPYLTIVFDLRD